MALQERKRPVRRNRRIAGGGRFPVRPAVLIARRRRRRLSSAGPASGDRSSCSRRPRSRPRAASVTPSKEEAFKNCGKLCWICVDGKVVQVSEAEAKAQGAKCYPSEREAQRDCGKLCWICVDGKLVQVTEAQAKARGARCYPTQERSAEGLREALLGLRERKSGAGHRAAGQRARHYLLPVPGRSTEELPGQVLLGLQGRTSRASEREGGQGPRPSMFRYPGRSQEDIVPGSFAGSALTDRWFRFLKLRRRRKAFPVILPRNEPRRPAGNSAGSA